MNYGKYDTICCKRCFYLLIYNELSCNVLGNELLKITNTMNINTILQPSNFNVFLYGYFLQCSLVKIMRKFLAFILSMKSLKFLQEMFLKMKFENKIEKRNNIFNKVIYFGISDNY